jgi:hypothetical protein
MEVRRKEEEWVRDWRRHTTIRHASSERDLHMVAMGGHWHPWRTRGKCKKWVLVPPLSSQIDLAPSTRSFKHLPSDNQPNCSAGTSSARYYRWCSNKEQAKITMLSWWNGLTLPLLVLWHVSFEKKDFWMLAAKWHVQNFIPITLCTRVYVNWSRSQKVVIRDPTRCVAFQCRRIQRSWDYFDSNLVLREDGYLDCGKTFKKIELVEQ